MREKDTRRLWVVERRIAGMWSPIYEGACYRTRSRARARIKELRRAWYLKYRVVSYWPEWGKS